MIVEELTKFTEVAESTTLDALGVDPLSSVKLTVDPATNPVPEIVMVVPPAIVPDDGLMDFAVGRIGDHVQFSTVSPEPQYTPHTPSFGALTPGG